MKCFHCQNKFDLRSFPERVAFADRGAVPMCWYCWAESEDPSLPTEHYRADCEICFSTIYGLVHSWAIQGLGVIAHLNCEGCGSWHDVWCTGYSPGDGQEKIYFRELEEYP